MKKLAAMLLTGVLTIGLVACGGSGSSGSSSASSSAGSAAASSASSASASSASESEAAEAASSASSESAAAASSASSGEESSAIAEEREVEDVEFKTDQAGKRLVLLVKNMNSDFWVSMSEYATARAEKYGFTLETLAPVTPESNEEQIQLLEQSLLDPPDGYIIVPADSEGITPAIEKINEAGIPVLNLNTKLTDENLDVISFVAIENHDVAYESAKASAEQLLDGKGKVLILEGTTGSLTSIDREEGADEAFAEFPEIEVLAKETANFARAEAMTVTQNLLSKYDDVDMIYATAGEMALGAYQAVVQAGREDQIKIGTINAFGEMIEAWCQNHIALTYDDAAWHQGEMAVDAFYKYFAGEPVDERIVVPAVQVTMDNIDMYIDMFGLDIDKASIDR